MIAANYAPGRATPTPPVREWTLATTTASSLRQQRPLSARCRPVSPAPALSAPDDVPAVTLRSMREARAASSAQRVEESAVQCVTRRLSQLSMKKSDNSNTPRSSTERPVVLPCADDVNQHVNVAMPARLLPPQQDAAACDNSSRRPRAFEKQAAPSPRGSPGRSPARPISISPPRRPRRERYYRQDLLPTAQAIQETLAATPRSPKPFQRRHLKGIPDVFDSDPRHQHLVANIAADVAFTTEKRRLEAVLRRRAEFAIRRSGVNHSLQAPGQRQAAQAAKSIAAKDVEEWGAVATARCFNAQSRFILLAATMRQRAMKEKLECETNTMLDDVAYLKKQLQSVDSMRETM
jgi:hypothetical protein